MLDYSLHLLSYVIVYGFILHCNMLYHIISYTYVFIYAYMIIYVVSYYAFYHAMTCDVEVFRVCGVLQSELGAPLLHSLSHHILHLLPALLPQRIAVEGIMTSEGCRSS